MMTDQSNIEIDISGPEYGVSDQCEFILRMVPEWFGVASGVQRYVNEIEHLPTFLARASGACVGFLAVKHHFEPSAEIYVMAVHPMYHGQGIGKQLVQSAEQWLVDNGCRFLQVKTLSPSHPSPLYENTRKFYHSVGFVNFEEMPCAWDAYNPCMVMIKTLDCQ